jgi:6-phosphofructokinase 1
VFFEPVPLRNVAKETRHVPDEFIAASGNDVTPAFVAYATPLVGELPRIGRFKGVRVAVS